MLTVLCTLFAFFVLLILLESAMLFLVRHPNVLRKVSRKLQNSISYLYANGERKIMQFLDGCGRYSSDLGYTLNPGVFCLTEREFSNAYHINTLGVRDTEEALNRPEIIVVGDSFALGWGVHQEETFAALIGQKSKRKTLNTAIPSYGTVREMLMLRKIDRSKAKCLIIQYCGDDYDENLRYYLNGNRPQIMREETFQRLIRQHSRPNKYFFGKYLVLKIKKKIKEFKPLSSAPKGAVLPSDVDLFLHVLKQNEDVLDSLPIIVLELSGNDQTDAFINSLKRKIEYGDHPEFIRQMIILEVNHHLKSEHLYVLDGHLNYAGHIVVADLIYETLKERKIL